MSTLIDKKYIQYIASSLEKFRWIRSNVAVCRCPFCGDGKKGKKTRFYFYKNYKSGTERFCYLCHNCNASGTFGNFLKEHNQSMYSEFYLECFIDKHGRKPYAKKEIKEEVPVVRAEKIKESQVPYAIPIPMLPEGHLCKEYVNKRMIPEEFHKHLYFTINMRKLVGQFINEEYAEKIPDDQRLIIPFYDEYGQITMLQGRALEKDAFIRYVTVKKSEDVEKTFGLDRINRSKEVYCCEGPIDSLFIDNCLASADSNLLKVNADIYIFDNQYMNKDIKRRIEQAIDLGKKVVLFPKSFVWKDINDAVMAGLTKQEIAEIIKEHTYSGIKAKLVFTKLNKSNTY